MKLKSSLRGLLVAAAGMSLLPLTAIAASAAKVPKNNAYIVQLAEQPVAAYAGGIAGYAATKPRKGQKVNPNDPQVVRYMGYLATRQDSLSVPRAAARSSTTTAMSSTASQPS